MFAVQREVKALIFEPDTPGGFRCSIDCRTLSNSATADDILGSLSSYKTDFLIFFLILEDEDVKVCTRSRVMSTPKVGLVKENTRAV